jgi:hypothetical protein
VLGGSHHQEDFMERGWIETIQLLGLDVMGGVALLMLLLAGLGDLARFAAHSVSRRLASRAQLGAARAVEPKNDAWPPEQWRPSH